MRLRTISEISGFFEVEAKVASSLQAVIEEYQRGLKKFGTYNSRHEAYAVIKEELDELWDEIKSNRDEGDEESIQVAATALRYVIEFVSIKK